MSDFKFNFGGTKVDANNEVQEEIEWFKSEEIIPQKQVQDIEELVKYAKMFTCGEVEIGHVKELLSQSDCNIVNAVELAEKDHSDLITGKYEGGLKIWECTYDLIEYLEENKDITFEKSNTLDLGCGAGILGIYAFLKGASVTFQDYNKEIIECLTIPNVLLNIEEDRENEMKKCRFYSGDWASFNDHLEENVYDIILTSETIYNVSNYDKLVTLFQRRLSQKGVIFVAAKTCYFGVGGGMRQLEEAIAKTGIFQTDVVWKTQSGIQREILKISRLK